MCSSCVEGFVLRSNECVAPCAFPCQICSTTGQCSDCYEGYNIQQSLQCTPDLSCNTGNTCTKCPRKYFLEMMNCLECTASNC